MVSFRAFDAPRQQESAQGLAPEETHLIRLRHLFPGAGEKGKRTRPPVASVPVELFSRAYGFLIAATGIPIFLRRVCSRRSSVSTAHPSRRAAIA